ncbi:MAG: FG-GAP-like repeat-containing protein, partial [Thermoplasmata archaeon]
MGFMRAAVALGLAALFLVPAGGPLSPAGLSLARVVSSFSNGSESGLLELRPPDENRELSISIPEHCYVVDASLSISTALSDGGWFPEAPVLDLEGDGKPEWAFCATGAGTFGLQTVTATGERTVELRFPSAGSQSFSLLLPKGALVTGASLNVSGRLDGIQFTNASIYGHGSYDMLGLSVAGGVDINRDGVDDVVIGAPGADTRGMTDNGAVAVLYGPLDGPLPAPDSVEGTESGELLGFSVAAVRDFDGDGFGEVLAGAPNATPRGAGTPTPNAGIALLLPYDTSAGRLRSVPARTIPGLTVNGQMGFSVAEIPDFNGDGRRDIAAGEILANRTVLQPYIGRVAALCSGELAPAPVNFWGESPYSLFGFCILRGPDSDLNRDGKPDLAIGSPLASPGGKGMVGAVYIFTGPEGGPWLVIQGDQPSGNFSASLAAGDFNGDGVADLAVGAPAMKNEGTETGAVVVYFGGKRGIDSSVSPVVLWGPLERARYGASLACPGDLDLDGCDELLVGAPGAARPAAAQRTGAVEVLFLGRNESVWIWGERPNENFGFSLSAAGDVNGDGLRDFIVGAPTSTGGSLEACGRAVVFTTHLLAPLNPSVCVGGLGADDWSFRGYYTRDLRIPDFSSKLNGLLQNPLREVEDEFGNVLVEIPVVVRSESAGTLIVHDISIAYKWTALVDRNPSAGNLTNSLNALLSHSASGNATRTIPLVLTSATPGSVWVHSPRIVIDEPPSCREDVAVELPEDTRDEHLLDLRSVFSDDFDTEELVFSLEGWTNASIVSLGISGGRWLSADALTGEANDNWTGEVEAAVSARDSRNLSR